MAGRRAGSPAARSWTALPRALGPDGAAPNDGGKPVAIRQVNDKRGSRDLAVVHATFRSIISRRSTRASIEPMKPMQRWVGGALLAASTLTAVPALGQTASTSARALFSEGRQLMKEGKYEQACPKFEESLRLDDGVGTQFNLAYCWENLGKTASAWALFLDVAAATRAAGQVKREAAAQKRADALQPKLARLQVEVPEPAAGMKVLRDGEELGAAAWGSAMPVDPGTHRVEVTAPGKKPWSEEIEVPAAAGTVSLRVPPLQEAALSESADALTLAPPIEPASSTTPLGEDAAAGPGAAVWITGGVGVAGIAAGTVFALLSRSSASDAASQPCADVADDRGYRCDSQEAAERRNGLLDTANRQRVLGYVGFGVGGAALLTSALLLLTADDPGDEAEPSALGDLPFDPIVGQNGAWGAVMRGTF